MKIVIILFFLINVSLLSQNLAKFTLSDCIEYSIKNSPAAKSAKASYKSRTNRIKAFNAGFLPQISLNASLPGLSREIIPVLQPDGSQLFQPQSQYFGSGSVSLRQAINPLGSEISISSGLSRIDAFGSRDYSIWRSTPIMISYSQPIFFYNSLKWESKVQEINEEINDNEYSSEIENISVNVTQKYFDVYIAKMNLKNAEQNVSVNDTLYIISKGRFEVGKIAENDLLQSELAYLNAQNSYERALLDYKQSIDEFRILLGISADKEININPDLIMPELDINDGLALKYALENNPSFRNFDIAKLRAEMSLMQVEAANNLNANLVASFGLNNSSDLLPDAYKELLQQQRLDITLQIPIFQWGRNSAQVEAALEDKNRTVINTDLQKNNLETEIKYEALRLKQLMNQVRISAKADTIASRRFEVAINRYYIGKIDLNSFFIAQNEKDSAFQSYIQMLKAFWTSYYNLRRLTLYDFIEKRVINHKI
ncbi:TolC family protein [Candidatus Kapaibacterium sp.]